MSELNLLYSLLRDATKQADLPGIFHVLFRGGREGLGVSEGLVLQHNPEKSTFDIILRTQGSLRDIQDLLSDNRKAIRELVDLEGSQVGRNAESLFFRDSRTQVAIRIPVDTRQSGVLILESPQAEPFSAEQLAFLDSLVEQTATIIRNRSRMESSRREAAAWWDVSRSIVNPSEMDISEMNTLLGKVLQLTMTRTRTANGIILLADEKTKELTTHTQAIMGDLISGVPNRKIKRRQGRASGIVFQVLDSNKPYLSNNIEKDPNYVPLFKGIKSHLSVPISFQKRCIGVIAVESPDANAFTLEDQQILEELSKNVVTLVRRAQLYEATRDDRHGSRGILIRGLSSEGWIDVERRVEKAAATNATVLLRGESGTGKELVAHAIHFNSKRLDKKLVIVNSAAIPEQLIESTLFGHVKGAFTDAYRDRVGEFEKADGGTLFLDEIGELDLSLQAKLLRALQDGQIQKVGSNTEATQVDVRVIAATSRNLEEMMAAGQFREDLYFRLNVVPVWLPALRQYKRSIPSFVHAFVKEIAREHSLGVKGVNDEAIALLVRHEFPGNVRELRNIIEQSVIMADGEMITIEDLPRPLVEKLSNKQVNTSSGRDFKSMKKQVLEEFERSYLEDLLSQVSGKISAASEISGLNRVSLYKLLRRHSIDAETYR